MIDEKVAKKYKKKVAGRKYEYHIPVCEPG